MITNHMSNFMRYVYLVRANCLGWIKTFPHCDHIFGVNMEDTRTPDNISPYIIPWSHFQCSHIPVLTMIDRDHLYIKWQRLPLKLPGEI